MTIKIKNHKTFNLNTWEKSSLRIVLNLDVGWMNEWDGMTEWSKCDDT